MGRRTKDKAGRKRIRDWKGLLGDADLRMRALTFLSILVVSTSMTFMQLGFVGVGTDGNYICYVMSLLGPISVCALLLGKGWGFLEGLLSGIVLFFHAYLQPLDIIERYFVTPLNSIVLYSVAGFVIGLFFAVALRNDPARKRSAVYAALVGLLSSTLVSLAFIVNFLVDMVAIAVVISNGREPVIPQNLVMAAAGLGKGDVQLLLDALLMTALSCVTIYAVSWYREVRGHVSVRTTFRVRLFVVVLLIFMVVEAAGYSAITMQSEAYANDHMKREVEYLCDQLEARAARIEGVGKIPEMEGLSESSRAELLRTTDLENVLKGFDLDDGTVVLFSDGKVVLSDNPAYAEGDTVTELFGAIDENILEEMSQTGEMRQMLYDVHSFRELMSREDGAESTSQLGYMKVGKSSGMYVMMAMPSSMVFATRSVTMLWTTISMAVVLLSVYVLAARLLNRVVVQPIDQTNGSLAKITEGNLDESVEVRDNVEFASLSDGINQTVGALKGWIAEAETRMERELATAKAIQASALPRTFPPFPEIDRFDIFASMDAAKEVGGDFFDFFLIDEHTLGFLIADVSGKGVPGALFMMAAKTEINNYMSTGMELAQAIASANAQLCANNDAGMFVTVWAATLDYESGELTYVNAGHNPPLLRHEGEWEWLKEKGGLFLGTFDTAKYKQTRLVLEEGDELLLYTDGVNEAFSPTEEEYGNDRLEAFLADHAHMHPRDLVRSLRADVSRWADGAEQSDDVTMLALEYGVAPEVTGSITLPAVLENLGKANDLVVTELDRRLCPADVKGRVEIALEELFVNVCRYAYADREQAGSVRVSYVYTANPSAITIELCDQGVPFNPLTREDPTMPGSIQEAKIGGLGIYMVKKSMDDFSYVYDGESNIVAFRKEW
ncbi:MAG: SpoIIE family protein phosphatase [Olsenella sp.]|nr:SpoIIE family protein phosphatase [Olsenella sp.]